MKKGDIVRKTISDGTPIGCIMQVTKVGRMWVNCVSLDTGISYSLLKNHLRVVDTYKLCLNGFVYERIIRGCQTSIIHDKTPKWIEMYKKQPEMVILKVYNFPQRMAIYNVDDIRNVVYKSNGSIQLRLDLGTRVI